ncbi:unnamed protein product, partial [Oncorhynchus mykiss]
SPSYSPRYDVTPCLLLSFPPPLPTVKQKQDVLNQVSHSPCWGSAWSVVSYLLSLGGVPSFCWPDPLLCTLLTTKVPDFFCLSLHPLQSSMCLQPIDYQGFQLFMATYLENDIPEELCQHLFTSFKSKTGGCSPEMPRAGVGLLEPRSIDAGISIQTEVACAPITGMNGKSILIAMGRPTPEPSTMMASCSGAISISPCSSRSSSQRSGMGPHAPGGSYRSPACTQVKPSTCSSSNTLTPTPAKSPASPRLSPGKHLVQVL